MSNDAKIYKTHILNALPSTGNKGIIYLVGTTSLKPYIWDGNGFIPFSGGDSSGDYNSLENKPHLNGVELIGNKSFSDISLNSIPTSELLEILT